MKTLQEVSSSLRGQIRRQGLTQARIERDAGVAHQTLVNVLGGEKDFKLTTLLAVVDRLGLEMVFVPKAAARGLSDNDTPSVKSRVEAALERVRGKVSV